MSLKSLFIKLFEIFAIILSALTLRYIQIRGRYWQDKIKTQLKGINTTERIRNHIINIVEDIYVSLSVLGQVILILYGVFVIAGKEIIESPFLIKNIRLGTSIFIILVILLSLVYFIAIIKLFRLKETLLSRPTVWRPIYTYKQLYEKLLYIGYGILILMSIGEIILNLLKNP